jgi:hypothetical protein
VRTRSFVVGLVAGAVGGACLAILAAIGALIGLPLIVIGLFIPPRLYGAAGTFIGFGAAIVALFGRVAIVCVPPGCTGPSMTPLVALGLGSLAVGLGVLALAALRDRR